MKNQTDETRAKDLVIWLCGLGCHITNISSIKVTIDNKDYFGARYDLTINYTPEMDAVRHGTKRAGDTYTEERLYLLGQRPHKIKNRSNFCFTYTGEDWFIGGYYEGNDSQYHQYHPFGKHFLVQKWSVPDGTKIDHYEICPYVRTPMLMVDLQDSPSS